MHRLLWINRTSYFLLNYVSLIANVVVLDAAKTSILMYTKRQQSCTQLIAYIPVFLFMNFYDTVDDTEMLGNISESSDLRCRDYCRAGHLLFVRSFVYPFVIFLEMSALFVEWTYSPNCLLPVQASPSTSQEVPSAPPPQSIACQTEPQTRTVGTQLSWTTQP